MSTWIARTLCSAAAFWLVCGCSPIHVQSDFDPEASFAGLETWGWVALPPTLHGNHPELESEILDRRIRRAVEGALEAKGYRRVESDPDFWVHYALAIEEKLDVDTLYSGGGYAGYGRWGGYAGAPRVETVVRQYDEGTFLLDVLSPDGRLLWRGTAQGRLNDRLDAEERERRARETAAALLEQFPPERKDEEP